MENKDKSKFSKLLWLFANDAGVKITKEQLSIKFERLKRFSIEHISKATDYLLDYREKTFPAIPAISEFVKIIEGFENPQISIDSQAEIQAALVLKQLRNYGRTWQPNFDDPITQKLMTERWAWYRWASEMKEDQEQWWKKDFIILYKSYSEECKAAIFIEAPEKFKKLAGGIINKF